MLMGAGDRACSFGHRLEIDCLAGQATFEASDPPGLAFFHIEGPKFPALARRMLASDASWPRSLHPFRFPMAVAEGANVRAGSGVPFGWDPSEYGQPCQLTTDCPSRFEWCFIDAAVTNCLAGPIGRCRPNQPSNCVSYPGCGCTRSFGGTICGGVPGMACGNVSSSGLALPSNSQLESACQACMDWSDAGVPIYP
jgi:hypothetical protein